MKKTILITGATDGIGLEAAKMLASKGHKVLLHGRNPVKLKTAEGEVMTVSDSADADTFMADLSLLADVEKFADEVTTRYDKIDVLINNAGVYKTGNTKTPEGFDVRFVVNTIAPYLLTKRLLPLMGAGGRVVNLSSAAQAPVDLNALTTQTSIPDSSAYAQSKLAITMWGFHLANELDGSGPAIIAVNPKSLLGSKMVKDAYGINGGDLSIGADILTRAALSDEFANASGRYFDNDIGQFAAPHPDALNFGKCREVTEAVESVIDQLKG